MPQRPRALSILLLLSPGVLAAASAAAAKPPKAVASVAPRTIAVDVGRVKGPHDKAFRLCVGAGRANEGLRADWQEQLATVQRECGFRYVRFHGLLHDDMGVYQETRDGKPVYNWQYVDALYDAILRAGVKPFVELGFMPGALASGTKTIFWWKGNVTPPKSYEKWEALIEALTRHFEERYGRDEVATWYFEVWNEPNLDYFWTGTQADYFELYARSVRAIKRVSPDYRVGGPATAGAAWAPEFLRYCAEQRPAGRLRLDAQLQRRRLPGRVRRAAAPTGPRQGRRRRRRAARRRRDQGLAAPGGRAALHGVERVLLLARPRARPLLLGALHPLAPEARRRRGAVDVLLDLQRRLRGGRRRDRRRSTAASAC